MAAAATRVAEATGAEVAAARGATRAVAELWGCGAVNLLGAVLSRSSRLVDTPALPLHLG